MFKRNITLSENYLYYLDSLRKYSQRIHSIQLFLVYEFLIPRTNRNGIFQQRNKFVRTLFRGKKIITCSISYQHLLSDMLKVMSFKVANQLSNAFGCSKGNNNHLGEESDYKNLLSIAKGHKENLDSHRRSDPQMLEGYKMQI